MRTDATCFIEIVIYISRAIPRKYWRKISELYSRSHKQRQNCRRRFKQRVKQVTDIGGRNFVAPRDPFFPVEVGPYNRLVTSEVEVLLELAESLVESVKPATNF